MDYVGHHLGAYSPVLRNKMAIRQDPATIEASRRYFDRIPFVPDLKPTPALDRQAPTAAVIVRNFDGLGIHSLLTIPRLFPNYFKNVIFISVGVIDSSTFKGAEEIENLQSSTEENLKSFAEYAN